MRALRDRLMQTYPQSKTQTWMSLTALWFCYEFSAIGRRSGLFAKELLVKYPGIKVRNHSGIVVDWTHVGGPFMDEATGAPTLQVHPSTSWIPYLPLGKGLQVYGVWFCLFVRRVMTERIIASNFTFGPAHDWARLKMMASLGHICNLTSNPSQEPPQSDRSQDHFAARVAFSPLLILEF